MKLLIGAAAAAFTLMATPALAQATLTANCTGFEAAPTVPDGATASRADVEAANQRVQAWAEARRAKLVLCQADVNAMSQAFNAAEQERRAVTAGWDTEVAEFNAAQQSGASNRRQRGGVLTRPDQ
jgi:hypothetical protein